jgi:lysophospholipase L1-like esterase
MALQGTEDHSYADGFIALVHRSVMLAKKLIKKLLGVASATLSVVVAGNLIASTDAQQWFSLDGQKLTAGNPQESDGLVRKFNRPVLRVTPTAVAHPKSTILLLPGGAYKVLDVVGEGSLTAATLSEFGYDVVILEYHIDSGDKTRDLALADALAAWRLIKANPAKLGVHGGRYGMMGYSAGGHLAARTLQALATDSPELQPDDLILIYPAYLNEAKAGPAAPQVPAPTNRHARLIAMIAEDDKPEWVKGCKEYVESWQRAGGQANFHQFKNGGHGFGMRLGRMGEIERWPEILKYFLENGTKPGVGPFNAVLPWFISHRDERLAIFQKDRTKDRSAIVFLGDSITEGWNLANAFPGLKVANRGIAGDTTRGMLCRLQDNVLDLHPKAIVLLGGINDLFHAPQGTPETIALNVRSMLEQIHTSSPGTPVLVCEILPCQALGADIVRAANAAVDKVVADFPNARRIKTHDGFLNSDGLQNSSLFTDGTHLTPAGYKTWEMKMQPELNRRITL